MRSTSSREYVAGLYASVDAMREEAATRLAAARRADGDREAVVVWQAEVARLDAVEQGLCFGRLDMHDGRRVYIGRLSLFREEAGEPLLVDWRAPVAPGVLHRDGDRSAGGCGDGGASPHEAGQSSR